VNVLIACEYSGTVRDAFKALGHYAVSCDFLDTDVPGNHFKGDVLELIDYHRPPHHQKFDLMIAHPPCTYLSVSGLHWNKRVPERAVKTEEALEFVRRLMNVDIPHICIENPVSCISSRIRKPDQIIQPYEYGHDASKKTCLWLKDLPLLVPSFENLILPRMVDDKPRWGNQTDSGQNVLGPSADRWKIRSKTYEGIAGAMAHQWSQYIKEQNV
jgi:hypothetical protein